METHVRISRIMAVATLVWVLVDVVRVWAPSLITLVGQAASTPAELMGAYALGCVVVAVLPLLLVRRGVLSVPTAVLALVVLAGCVVRCCRRSGERRVGEGGRSGWARWRYTW